MLNLLVEEQYVSRKHKAAVLQMPKQGPVLQSAMAREMPNGTLLE